MTAVGIPLLEQVTLNATDRVLSFSAGDPALIRALGKRVSSLQVYDTSAHQLEHLRGFDREANIDISDDVFPPADSSASSFDVALIFSPKGRELARAQLWSAFLSLRPKGKLYIAGHNDSGVKTVLDDAKVLFGHGVTLSYKHHQRLSVAIKSDHPDARTTYPADWGDIPTVMQERVFQTPHGSIPIATMPGIFSWKHLDDGTAFLLENLNPVPEDQSILDIGSGNGIIGVTLGRSAKAVVLTDDNLLAVRCARQSVALNGMSNANVHAADLYSGLDDQRFDLIVANPPFHREFDVSTDIAGRIISESAPALNQGGRLVAVANAFLKYEDVFAKSFKRVTVLAKNNRYMVIEGKLPR